MHVCAEPGCPTLTRTTRCQLHTRQQDRARGSRQARGYTSEHDTRRRAWAALIASGHVDCHAPRCLEPLRRIAPGSPWDLGHTPDRLAWTGPEHPRCNRAAGGRSAHR